LVPFHKCNFNRSPVVSSCPPTLDVVLFPFRSTSPHPPNPHRVVFPPPPNRRHIMSTSYSSPRFLREPSPVLSQRLFSLLGVFIKDFLFLAFPGESEAPPFRVVYNLKLPTPCLQALTMTAVIRASPPKTLGCQTVPPCFTCNSFFFSTFYR